jgi:hypothetical protein
MDVVSSYINHKMKHLSGWLRKDAARLIAELGAFQNESGIEGNLFEIGAYHGKLTILLALLRKNNEKLGVCDILDDRGYNYLHSTEGYGKTQKPFENNISRYLGEAIPNERFVLYNKSSESLAIEEFPGAIRLFSIDGCHLDKVVEKDFRLALSALSEKGCIIHDDFFNSTFPGASMGIAKVLVEEKDSIAPFMIGFNKLFVCRAAHLRLYRSLVEQLKPKAAYIKWKFFDTVILNRPVTVFQNSIDFNYYTLYYDYCEGHLSWRIHRYIFTLFQKLKRAAIDIMIK